MNAIFVLNFIVISLPHPLFHLFMTSDLIWPKYLGFLSVWPFFHFLLLQWKAKLKLNEIFQSPFLELFEAKITPGQRSRPVMAFPEFFTTAPRCITSKKFLARTRRRRREPWVNIFCTNILVSHWTSDQSFLFPSFHFLLPCWSMPDAAAASQHQILHYSSIKV